MADLFTGKARLLLLGAGPLLVLGLASCSSTKDSGVALGNSAQGTTTTIAGSVPLAVETTTIAPLPAPDGAAVLQTALDQLAPGYHFVTTATVNGTPVITAYGDRVGDATRMNVASNGVAVDYVLAPGGTWVNKEGTWSEITDETPPADPIGLLRAPTSVTVTSYGAGVPTVLTATYPPAALSLAGDAAVSVVLTVNVGLNTSSAMLMSLAYSTTTDAGAADVYTDISALVDTSPVTLPQV